jgi:trans-aconitate 2-methyltransferase
MLERAAEQQRTGLRFEQADVREWVPDSPPDLLFSNAALQWVDGHEQLWPRLAGLLAPGGQIAVQMPVNDDHPSHTVARELAAEQPYAEVMAGYERSFPVLAPERYAELLWALGFKRRLVRVHVYEHPLPSTDAVVEWVKGSLLTPYRERLAPPLYEQLLAEYARRLRAHEGDRRPYLYPFKRLLVWGRLPADRRAASAG